MVKQWKARAVLGDKEKGTLVLSRMIGESLTISLNGEVVEITVVKIANNSVALMVETAKKNLIMRKELIPASSSDIDEG